MPDRPDLVDLDQVAARLDVDVAALQRLRRRRVFPPPDLHFGRGPVWHWDRISHWASQRRLSLRTPYPHPPAAVELVDLPTLSRRLGVPEKVARHWSRSGKLVDPDYRWSHAEAWLWETVQQWIEARNRPSETPLWSDLARKFREARKLVGNESATPRLRILIDELEAAEVALLGGERPRLAELSDAELLAHFDSVAGRLDQLGRSLAGGVTHAGEGEEPRSTAEGLSRFDAIAERLRDLEESLNGSSDPVEESARL